MEAKPAEVNCINCSILIAQDARFCNNCGALQEKGFSENSQKQDYWLFSLAIFFFIQLLVCLIGNFSDKFTGLGPLLIFDIILSLVTIVWVIMMRKELKGILTWKSFSITKLLLYGVVAIIVALIVNFIVAWLNKSIFNEEFYIYRHFSHLKYAKLITILVIALQPAIFEELAFRGVMQEGLSKLIGSQTAIYVSAFLFAIIHMSFISLFWLIPFAIWLGYLRYRESTIWYGVFIHFCFNATACVLEFF